MRFVQLERFGGLVGKDVQTQAQLGLRMGSLL